MLAAALLAVVAAVMLYLLRAFVGPTVYDRILALNAVGTKTVLLVALLGALGGRTDLVDIAVLYALINFIATLAMLELVHLRRRRRDG
ncbi:MAG: monovalent cation/H+ antiporter complex subunit F [Acidobacteriota bacterium]